MLNFGFVQVAPTFGPDRLNVFGWKQTGWVVQLAGCDRSYRVRNGSAVAGVQVRFCRDLNFGQV